MADNLKRRLLDVAEFEGLTLAEEAADRIEELEAKLAQAVRLMDLSVELARWELNPKLQHDVIVFCNDLKGYNDEPNK